MPNLALQYSVVGICSGPLQTYLRSTRALESADSLLRQKLSRSQFLAALPHEWLFVTVRYGCADFYGRPTVHTTTTPTKQWKLDKKDDEFVAIIRIDGSGWEVHDKDKRQRRHLEAKEIERQVVATVVPALRWVACIFNLPDLELATLQSELGPPLQGAIGPGDMTAAEAADLLKSCLPY